MSLTLSQPPHERIDLGTVASIAWCWSPSQTVRWTIDTSVPVMVERMVIQPPASGTALVIDVPEGQKLRVGSALVWLSYEDKDQRFRVRIDSPPQMRADSRRNKVKPTPKTARIVSATQEYVLLSEEHKDGEPWVVNLAAKADLPELLTIEGRRYQRRSGGKAAMVELNGGMA